MTVDARLHAIGRNARTRRAAISALYALPAAAVLIAVGARLGGWIGALVAVIVVGIAIVFGTRRAMRSIDDAWIARRLDSAEPRLEDSADLLFRDTSTLSPLQQLQRARLHRRIESEPVADVALPWPWRRIALAWLIGIAIIALVALAPPNCDARRRIPHRKPQRMPAQRGSTAPASTSPRRPTRASPRAANRCWKRASPKARASRGTCISRTRRKPWR